MTSFLPECSAADMRQWFLEDDPPRWCREFVQDIGQFNLAVDLLLLTAKKKTWTEVVQYCREHGIRMSQYTPAIRFLLGQRLLSRTSPRKPDGESIYKAMPKAIDELAYRLVHNGEPSPAPIPPDPEAQRTAARDKLTKALAAADYRDGKANRRLRVAK